MTNHAHFMKKAIAIAKQNRKSPFGALLVETTSDEIVATGLNHAKQNPTLHGEMVAIHDFAATGRKNWESLRLYTTAEPCCMCQAAIIWARIPEVIFGTSIETLGKLGWRQFRLTAADVVKSADFSDCQITGGVLEPECDDLFRNAKTA